ncbi:uncharacterized protein PFLUO_LOCUS637 [Penicillium psychrofluorescens]|uniref:uncharacterized protein n=1 Tax=Penicillium psychrofluorescens TaxID=3158075 RepID=UPI003CCD9C02
MEPSDNIIRPSGFEDTYLYCLCSVIRLYPYQELLLSDGNASLRKDSSTVGWIPEGTGVIWRLMPFCAGAHG